MNVISVEYLRQFRIEQFAIFDTVAAFLGALILAPLLTWLASKLHLKIPISSWLWFTLPLAVVFHLIFQQATPLMKILANPSQLQFYIALVLLLTMVYLGSRKISKIA